MKRHWVTICALLLSTSVSWAAYTWSEPVLLTELNDSSGNAAYPHFSRDGSTLYFGRKDAGGTRQLYTATKDSVTGDFSNISQISELATGDHSYSPWVSDDNLRLYYGKYRSDITLPDEIQLYQAARENTTDPWSNAILFSDIQVSGYDNLYPSLTSDELTMFYISDRGNASNDTRIWMATRTSINGQFSNATLVSELNSGHMVLGPCILPDGLTIYYAEKTNNQYDILRATRSSISDPFSNIESISLNTPFGIESSPYVTPDETEIFFTTTEGIYYTYQIPEPATLTLLALGTVLLGRKKRA